MKNLFLFLVTLSFTHTALAQLSDRFSISQLNYGNANDVSMNNSTVQASHRFYLGDATILSANLSYSQFNVTDDNDDLSSPDNNRGFYSLIPNFSFITSLSGKNNLITILRPGFYGDGEGNMGEDFRLEGGFIYTNQFSNQLTMGLGAARGTNLGRDLIVPLFQFTYYMNDQITISGVLPVRASIWYIHDEKWQFGGIFRLEGSVYNIDESSLTNAQAVGIGHALIGGATKYTLFGDHYLMAELGITALRRYEWVDAKGASTNIGQEPYEERELDNTVFLRIGWNIKY